MERGMGPATDEYLQPLAVGKDGGLLPRPTRRLGSEIPIEAGLDHRAHLGADLRLVKRRAQLRDSEYVGYARAFHVVVWIDQARVVEPAPGDHPADARVGGGFAVSLGVPHSLLLLRGHISRAAILAVKTFAFAVVELSHPPRP